MLQTRPAFRILLPLAKVGSTMQPDVNLMIMMILDAVSKSLCIFGKVPRGKTLFPETRALWVGGRRTFAFRKNTHTQGPEDTGVPNVHIDDG